MQNDTPHYLTTAGAAVPHGFIGRERELVDIRNLLKSGDGTLALVNAEGGMGKTTLAAAYWNIYQNEYKHVAWLFCDNGIITAMRDQLPDPLGLLEDMNRTAGDADKQIALIRNRMANLEKDCLLVLDNANEPGHIRGFEQYCVGLGWHVLITSRCSNVLRDGRGEYKITSLPPDQARTLFKNNYTENNPAFEALLDRFLEAVGYNTLCIEIFSKNLREGAAWGLNFEKLLQQLEQNGLLLGDDSFQIRTHYTQNLRSEAATSDQIVEAMYNVSSLPPDESDLLAQFCLLPAESHPPTVLAALLAPDDKAQLKRQLDNLAQKGWLGTDTNTYRVSPIVQKIVLGKNTDRRWELGATLVKRLQVILEAEGYHSKHIATAAPFAERVFGLVKNLGEVANHDLALLFDRLWVYYHAIGNLARALDTAEQMRENCKKSDNKNDLAISYEKLGSTHSELGNLEQALTYFKEQSRLGQELYAAYPENVAFKHGLAISYSKLGSTHSTLGNLKQALTFFKNYNTLEEELYAANPQNVEFKKGLAISFQFLGITQSALGNLDRALKFFESYNILAKELYTTNPQNAEFKKGLAISYEKLGSTLGLLGNLDQALTFFEDETKLFEELYAAYPQNVAFKNGLAISCQFLGETHSALGHLEHALTFFEKYNALTKELYAAYPENVSFKNGLGWSYYYLGQFYRYKKDDPEKAKTYFQQCYELWKELSEAYPAYAEFWKNFERVKEAMEVLGSD